LLKEAHGVSSKKKIFVLALAISGSSRSINHNGFEFQVSFLN
jgi:hypothetical protein